MLELTHESSRKMPDAVRCVDDWAYDDKENHVESAKYIERIEPFFHVSPSDRIVTPEVAALNRGTTGTIVFLPQ